MTDEPRPWEMSASAYQSRLGVHQPWIGEISPFQYSRLSNRARRAYEAKRREEWQASADAKAAWRSETLATFDRGEIALDTPGLHIEAARAIRQELRAREKAEKEHSFDAACRDNRIHSVEELKLGCRVFDIMLRRYGTVLKKFAKSVRLRFTEPLPGGGAEITVPVGELQWFEYNDLKVAVQGALDG